MIAEGASVKGYDPVAATTARAVMPPSVKFEDDPYDLAAGCDAIVLVTPWNELKQLDFERIKRSMKTPVMVDGRNLYDPAAMHTLGFQYRGVGRGYNDRKK
jgi:UDPglucose 6-dehydrogenase